MRLLVVVLAAGIFLPFVSLEAELTVAFESEAVIVQGVSPGGDVALLGVAKEPGDFRPRVTYRRELLTDGDADGVVSYPVERRAPATSVWVLADVASGAVAVATPEDGVMREVAFPLDRSLRALGGELVLIDDRRAELDVLYVRPGVGGWQRHASDGAPSDGDGATDGRVRVRLGDLKELGGGARQLRALLPGDLLVAIDRYRGEFYVLRLGAPGGR